MKPGTLRIGAASDCDIQLGGIYVLDYHCTLTVEEVLTLKPVGKGVRKGAGVGVFVCALPAGISYR